MMNRGYSGFYRLVKMAAFIAGLLAMLQPAFALEINNNASAILVVSIKECSKHPIKTEIPPGQVYGCTYGECTGTCSYSIKASGNKKCKGTIDAGSGLQVDKGLTCKPY